MSHFWNNAITEHQQAILSLWMERLLVLYSGKIAANSFVADSLSKALADVLRYGGKECNELSEALKDVTCILAVQAIPPSQTLALFFELPAVLRDYAVKGAPKQKLKESDMDELQKRLEELTLKAFDSYMMHRETISQLKVDEMKRQLFMQLRRAEA